MLLMELADGDRLYRYKKALVLLFHGKRTVLSTGPNNGGYREDLTAVFNHDMNPGEGMPCELRADTYEEHMHIVAEKDLGLDPRHCSGLCTAASMDNASIQKQRFEELEVTAVVTGGIERNAGRAGDPATFAERAGQFYTLRPGTINILLHMNCSMDPGTLARCLVTATEAKTAAIQELMAPSCYSEGIATGSGTDGTIIISNPQGTLHLTNAGKNSKLGELIGKTVKLAVKEALYRQSGLCPELQHDILRRMGRFGITEDHLWQRYLKKTESCKDSRISRAEFTNLLDHMKCDENRVVWTSLYAHLLDEYAWGLLNERETQAAARHILDRIFPPAERPACEAETWTDVRKKLREQYSCRCLQAIVQSSTEI